MISQGEANANNNDGLQELEEIAVLCAERVSQMTRTYNDIEAVTHLLEEKERDLELAARIGQTLLSKNKELSGRKEALEEQLSLANDTIKQLRHELSRRVHELEVYDQDLQNQSTQDESLRAKAKGVNSTVEKLQRKVGALEEENDSLRLETVQLRSDKEKYDEKEKERVKDCFQQFADLNQQVHTLTEELQVKRKESSQQREEITTLVAQLNQVCQRVRQLTEENADLFDKLQAAQESQTQLARELSVQKDKYDELFETLEVTRDELRGHCHGSQMQVTRQCSSPGAISMDSLACELQRSLSHELSHDEDKRNRSCSWRVFETAKAAHKAVSKSRSNSLRMSPSMSSSWDTDSVASIPHSDTESFVSDGYSGDMDSLCGSSMVLGRPGIPGSNDLQSALQRLALRHGHETDEDVISKSQQETGSEVTTPYRIPGSPDTVSSTPSGYSSYMGCSKNLQSSSSSSQFRISSNKLQIVKPMEGSVTLQHWQRLAQPHLGGLFESREGVKVKGERKLDLDEEAFTISDFEEDVESMDDARGMMASTPDNVFTPTLGSSASHCSHHSGGSHNSSRHYSSGPHSPAFRGSARGPQPVATSIPVSVPASRQGSGKTSSSYTMSLGLAAILNTRDTSLARALMKTSASCPMVMAGSSSGAPIPVIPADSVATVSGGSLSQPDKGSNHSLFSKLINNGYSLLWNKSTGTASSTPTSVPSQETVPPADSVSMVRKPSTRQVFPSGGSGVLGTLTTLRKNGAL